MTSYQLSGEAFVYRHRDGQTAVIPTATSELFPNTNPDFLEYQTWLAEGNSPLPAAPPPDELAETRKRAFEEVREMRAPMLNAVTGIMVNALADNDVAVVEEAQSIRQKLLDITSDPALNAATTYESMKLAGQLAYRRIAKAATPSFASVFKEITGA